MNTPQLRLPEEALDNKPKTLRDAALESEVNMPVSLFLHLPEGYKFVGGPADFKSGDLITILDGQTVDNFGTRNLLIEFTDEEGNQQKKWVLETYIIDNNAYTFGGDVAELPSGHGWCIDRRSNEPLAGTDRLKELQDNPDDASVRVGDDVHKLIKSALES